MNVCCSAELRRGAVPVWLGSALLEQRGSLSSPWLCCTRLGSAVLGPGAVHARLCSSRGVVSAHLGCARAVRGQSTIEQGNDFSSPWLKSAVLGWGAIPAGLGSSRGAVSDHLCCAWTGGWSPLSLPQLCLTMLEQGGRSPLSSPRLCSAMLGQTCPQTLTMSAAPNHVHSP